MNNGDINTETGTPPAPVEHIEGGTETFDLDAIFGEPQDGSPDNLGGSGQPPKPTKKRYENLPHKSQQSQQSDNDEGGNDLPPLESDIFDDIQTGSRTFRGNMPKDPLAVISKLQSERDKALAQAQSWETQVNEFKSASDFLAELEEDAEVRRAFIAELEPDLVKPKNPYSLIEETLREEFKDFTPNPDEANLFGSKTWIYNQRAQELLTEAKEKAKKTIPGSLKELRALRKKQADDQRKAALKEKQEIMSTLKWDDNTWEGFANWMQVTKGADWAKMYSYLLRQSGKAPKSLATQRGSSFENPRGKAFEGLNDFFG